ncbi:MAG: Undecaprenyl phosphate-alpha-4-amino-4-deoxy-L-arabinose arabinosyl transferase [Syntrophaceae bacterium PtaU1.Bin231]|nr:MAG: Undecaprenyl phosphate-alpha-4-amino-4-deoxy-L-arabinose arabinosyl transferase [Syntrophaceae bacterium PtaU1.Bin231]HOG16538.1 glycosyltransferase family 39 protein [Syntrophales bacterium]
MRDKIPKLLVLAVVPALLYVVLLGALPLIEPDEGRYSDIPSLMNRLSDYVTPRLQHVVYLEKPPLVYWATALSFQLFGESEWSSRLFVGLCAWGCILLTYFMGRRLSDERTGLYAAAVLSTMLYTFLLGRIHILDLPLTLFVCLAVWTGFLHFRAGAARRWRLWLTYLFAALAFLAKGLIGLVFPFAILFVWLLSVGRWREVPRLVSPVGILVLLAVSLPWVILVQKANPDFLWFFFVQEHFLRYTTTMHGRDQGFWYYIPVLIGGTLPWSAFLWKLLRERPAEEAPLFAKEDRRFLWSWFWFILLFFTASSSKLVPYIAPVFLPAALYFGRLIRSFGESAASAGSHTLRLLPVAVQAALFIAVLVLPPFLRNTQLGGDLVLLISERWPLLVAAPIALQVALLVVPEALWRRTGRGWFVSAYAITVLFLASLLPAAGDLLGPYKSVRPVVEAMKTHMPAGRDLYQYRIAMYGIDFYAKVRTPIVDDFGELGFGIAKLPPDERERYFLHSERFYELVKEKGDIYCVTQYKERLNELKKRVPVLEILWDNGAYYLLRLRG